MQQFLENNWLSILSIVIGIIVAFTFYRLQKKDSASASAERKKHATNELLEVVESYIINKQKLSEQVIDNLIHASERDHIVVLRPTCSAISLLQDVALRLQRSRHLDIPQKSEYSETIELLIHELRERRVAVHAEDLHADIAQKITELEALLPQNKQIEAKKIISEIGLLSQRQRIDSLRTEESKKWLMGVTTSLFGVSAALATSLIGSKAFDGISISKLEPILAKVFPILGVILGAAVAVQALTTFIRIKRRKQESHNRETKSGG